MPQKFTTFRRLNLLIGIRSTNIQEKIKQDAINALNWLLKVTFLLIDQIYLFNFSRRWGYRSEEDDHKKEKQEYSLKLIVLSNNLLTNKHSSTEFCFYTFITNLFWLEQEYLQINGLLFKFLFIHPRIFFWLVSLPKANWLTHDDVKCFSRNSNIKLISVWVAALFIFVLLTSSKSKHW